MRMNASFMRMSDAFMLTNELDDRRRVSWLVRTNDAFVSTNDALIPMNVSLVGMSDAFMLTNGRARRVLGSRNPCAGEDTCALHFVLLTELLASLRTGFSFRGHEKGRPDWRPFYLLPLFLEYQSQT
jgi:hypothetical protein